MTSGTVLKPRFAYSQGLGELDFETDDAVRVRFRKSVIHDKVAEIVLPSIDGDTYTKEIVARYWRIRELLFPEEPQVIYL